MTISNFISGSARGSCSSSIERSTEAMMDVTKTEFYRTKPTSLLVSTMSWLYYAIQRYPEDWQPPKLPATKVAITTKKAVCDGLWE
jgi:hypothetical protein